MSEPNDADHIESSRANMYSLPEGSAGIGKKPPEKKLIKPFQEYVLCDQNGPALILPDKMNHKIEKITLRENKNHDNKTNAATLSIAFKYSDYCIDLDSNAFDFIAQFDSIFVSFFCEQTDKAVFSEHVALTVL